MLKHRMLVCASALLVAIGCADTSDTVADAEEPLGLASDVETVAPTELVEEEQAPAPAAAAGQAAPARKLVSPVRGEAPIEFTQPQAKRDGNFIVTTFKVKNIANAPIAGLRIDEFWYDKAGTPVTGAPTFRHRSPLQPGEVIDVTLKVPSHPAMERNSFRFEHANGTIKPNRVPKL